MQDFLRYLASLDLDICGELLSPGYQRVKVGVFTVSFLWGTWTVQGCLSIILLRSSSSLFLELLPLLIFPDSLHSLPGEYKAILSQVFLNDVFTILLLQKEYLLVKIKFRNIMNPKINRCRVLDFHYSKITFLLLLISFFNHLPVELTGE